MKFVFSMAMIVALASIAIFGFLVMNHDMHETGAGCLTPSAQGLDCAKIGSVFSLVSIHFSALRELSLAVIFLALLSVLIIELLARVPASAVFFSSFSALWRRFEFFFYSQREKFLKWLSLFENSPSSA